ncbi:MAG TPA: hypothetical protein VHW45_03945 [Candidatus Sulfotelmatobacter sp.]|nr:hypothetical protein [Candidatus Sulfotelmatobacter sp.]
MDTGDLRTDALLPALAPSSAADEPHPPNQTGPRERRRSRFEGEPGEAAPSPDNGLSSDHQIDRLA